MIAAQQAARAQSFADKSPALARGEDAARNVPCASMCQGFLARGHSAKYARDGDGSSPDEQAALHAWNFRLACPPGESGDVVCTAFVRERKSKWVGLTQKKRCGSSRWRRSSGPAPRRRSATAAARNMSPNVGTLVGAQPFAQCAETSSRLSGPETDTASLVDERADEIKLAVPHEVIPDGNRRSSRGLKRMVANRTRRARRQKIGRGRQISRPRCRQPHKSDANSFRINSDLIAAILPLHPVGNRWHRLC